MAYAYNYMPLLTLLLLSTVPLAAPFGWDLFNYGDDDDGDDQSVNATQAANTTVEPDTSPFNCHIIDDFVSSVNQFWDKVDKAINPWHEDPPKPTEPPPPTTTPRPPPRY